MIILGLPMMFRGNTWWHLGSTESLEDLEAFARKIGLKPEWLQVAGSHPHYDITGNFMRKALETGAVHVGREQYIWDVFRGKA